jgi:hypothetical protein
LRFAEREIGAAVTALFDKELCADMQTVGHAFFKVLKGGGQLVVT